MTKRAHVLNVTVGVSFARMRGDRMDGTGDARPVQVTAADWAERGLPIPYAEPVRLPDGQVADWKVMWAKDLDELERVIAATMQDRKDPEAASGNRDQRRGGKGKDKPRRRGIRAAVETAPLAAEPQGESEYDRGVREQQAEDDLAPLNGSQP